MPTGPVGGKGNRQVGVVYERGQTRVRGLVPFESI